MPRPRTNIAIDDDLVRTVMDRSGIQTKTDAVNLGLRYLADQPVTREGALATRGAHAIEKLPGEHTLTEH